MDFNYKVPWISSLKRSEVNKSKTKNIVEIHKLKATISIGQNYAIAFSFVRSCWFRHWAASFISIELLIENKTNRSIFAWFYDWLSFWYSFQFQVNREPVRHQFEWNKRKSLGRR